MTKHPIKRFGFIGLCLITLGAVTLRDPTQPPLLAPTLSLTETALTSLQLTAVFVYPTYNLAIINGLALKEGDHIGEYTITRIDANTVELRGPADNLQHLSLVLNVKK